MPQHALTPALSHLRRRQRALWLPPTWVARRSDSRHAADEHWIVPTFVAAFGFAPAFCGVGTDRSGQILEVAKDERRRWSAAALADVPGEMRLLFQDDSSPPPGRANGPPPPRPVQGIPQGHTAGAHGNSPTARPSLRAGRAASTMASTTARRFAMPPHVRRGLTWWVEDTGQQSDAAAFGAARHPPQMLYDLILCCSPRLTHSGIGCTALPACMRQWLARLLGAH